MSLDRGYRICNDLRLLPERKKPTTLTEIKSPETILYPKHRQANTEVLTEIKDHKNRRASQSFCIEEERSIARAAGLPDNAAIELRDAGLSRFKVLFKALLGFKG